MNHKESLRKRVKEISQNRKVITLVQEEFTDLRVSVSKEFDKAKRKIVLEK